MIVDLGDGTIVDRQGNYIFVSEKRFVDLTRNEQTCFVCLRNPNSETLEHIVPNWVQRVCGLARSRVQLANGSKVLYPQWKVPCCEACNQLLRRHFEDPISKAHQLGFEEIKKLHKRNPHILLGWLSLIYFKTHYKDLFLNNHLNHKKSTGRIGDSYDWGIMAWPHAFFRAPIYRTFIKSIMGSLCVIKIKNPTWADLYDYKDDFLSSSVYIRIGDIALLAVFNDGGLCNEILRNRFLLDGGGFVTQSLEVLTDYQALNLSLRTRPDYYMGWDTNICETYLRSELPNNFTIENISPKNRHQMLWRNIEQYSSLKINSGRTLKQIKPDLLEGKVNFGLAPFKPSTIDRSLFRDRSRHWTAAVFYG